MRKERIILQLRNELSPTALYVENESDQHQGPPGRETHFKVVAISDGFSGKSRVERHQYVYSLLQNELDEGLHALALKLFTPIEWEVKKDTVNLNSPNCSHSKK